LCACAPGQEALVSEELGRSVFGYYFEEGLRGYSDGYGGQPRDGHISVRDVAAFVAARVDRWAFRSRGVRQTPLLLGSGDDFSLGALDHGQPYEHTPLPPDLTKSVAASAPAKETTKDNKEAKSPYPSWLLDGWKLRDRWWQEGV